MLPQLLYVQILYRQERFASGSLDGLQNAVTPLCFISWVIGNVSSAASSQIPTNPRPFVFPIADEYNVDCMRNKVVWIVIPSQCLWQFACKTSGPWKKHKQAASLSWNQNWSLATSESDSKQSCRKRWNIWERDVLNLFGSFWAGLPTVLMKS